MSNDTIKVPKFGQENLGTVVAGVYVKRFQTVKAGQRLASFSCDIWDEDLYAPCNGRIGKINFQQGDEVEQGADFCGFNEKALSKGESVKVKGPAFAQPELGRFVLTLSVKNGDHVKRGDHLFTVSCDTENRFVNAPCSGIITGINFKQGAMLEESFDISCSIGGKSFAQNRGASFAR